MNKATALPSPEARERALSQVVQAWSSKEPAAAAQWMMSQRDSQTRTNAVSSIVSNWGRRDPAQAAAWLDKLPVGTARDVAV